MILLLLALFVVIALYFYGIRNHKYWKRKGVKHDKPIPFFGNNAKKYLMQKCETEIAAEIYWKYPTEKVVGFYRASRPELVIRDPEIAKRILTTDFAYFYPRGLNENKHNIEPLMKNLFFGDGDIWRLLRQRTTSAFTSGKLKKMFPLIVERAERMQALLMEATAKEREIDARDIMARYATDFIGACGFGFDSDSLKDENSAFRKLGAKIFKIGVKEVFVSAIIEIFPSIFKHLKKFTRVEKGMFQLVSQVLRQRNYEPSGRNDFIDLLLECKKKGTIVGDSIERFKSNGKPELATLKMDEELITGQVFIFFAAGFETSSSATSFTLHELAYHPEVQSKAQDELDVVLKKYDNKFSYDAIKEMKYLQWTIKEAMRLFPPIGFLIRECAHKYTIEELNLTIDAGVKIIIPTQAMQNDPIFFENPNDFVPERLDPKKFDMNNKDAYLPFGTGPRACIGERLGLMQSVAGLAAVLSRFTVRPAPSTKRHPTVNPACSIVQTIQGGLPLLFFERKPKQY